MKTFDVGKTIITRAESENAFGSQQRVKGYADIMNSKNEEKILWLVQGEKRNQKHRADNLARQQ